MPFVGETVHSILAAQIPFAVLAVMLEGNLLPELEERGELIVLCSHLKHRWLDDEEWHFRGGDRHACGVIKLNEVRLGLIWL